MSIGTMYMCRSCRSSCSRSPALRAFATSSKRSAIPPESPNYVDIPKSFQIDFTLPRIPKGVLPVPREIFPPQRPDKPSEEYLSRSAPAPRKAVSSASKGSEQANYKSRMSELRRSHLRSGLLELYNRKVIVTQALAAKSYRRQRERARLVAQPPREDDRLTSSSIPSAMRIKPAAPSAARAEITAAKHARSVALTESKVEAKRLSRLDALHTLYMHARDFITTEDQLNAEIDQIFDNPQLEWSTAATNGSSIWNLGPPITVRTMLQEMQGRFPAATAAASGGRDSTAATGGLAGGGNNTKHSERYRVDQERMKKIAEVLSGGAM